jgi:PAS domain S-box-containing protein
VDVICHREQITSAGTKFSAVLVMSISPTLAVDATGTICMWSGQAEDLLGYSRAEAMGQSIEIIIPQHLRARHWSGFGRYVQTGTSMLPEVVTSPAIHKTGKPLKLEISVKAVYGDGQKIVAVEAFMRAAGDEEAR